MNKRNGDMCGEKAGRVTMYVNGAENNEFRNFIFRPCESKNIEQDCDLIIVKFE